MECRGPLALHKAVQGDPGRTKEILQQMNLPPHAAQAQISTTIRMIEKYGTDGLLCRCCKKAKLQLLYVVDVKGHKEVQRE